MFRNGSWWEPLWQGLYHLKVHHVFVDIPVSQRLKLSKPDDLSWAGFWVHVTEQRDLSLLWTGDCSSSC